MRPRPWRCHDGRFSSPHDMDAHFDPLARTRFSATIKTRGAWVTAVYIACLWRPIVAAMGGQRPGSVAAVRLFKTTEAAAWQEHIDAYASAIATVGAARKKEKDLVNWNAFMSAGLPQKAREEGKLSLRDMQVVMPRKIKIHTKPRLHRA